MNTHSAFPFEKFQMERNFAADGKSGVMTPQLTMSVDDAYLTGLLPELSFQSLLQPLPLTLNMSYSPFFDVSRVSSSFQMPATVESSSPVRCGFVSEEFSKMKMPKQERLNTKDFAFELLKLNNGITTKDTEPLINFFASSSAPTTINPSLRIIDATEFTGHFFSHLPLQPLTGSYENEQYLLQFHNPAGGSSSVSSFSEKHVNSGLTTANSAPDGRRVAEGVVKRRRQRISDKVRSLEKLLPWNKRMDTATVLEEAYKYVKFLQAQIGILQAMPIHSTGSCWGSSFDSSHENPNLNEFGGGVLAMLNRQQLLEVLMNSPAAQSVLYSRGSCVYSFEQLLLLKKMADKAAMEQWFFPSSQY